MLESPARTFYRIIQSDQATEADFLPYGSRGGPIPTDPQLRRMWSGISVYDTLDRARSQALKRPGLGAYIAELEVQWGRSVRAERTGHRRGYHTLWGEPSVLLACVRRIVPV